MKKFYIPVLFIALGASTTVDAQRGTRGFAMEARSLDRPTNDPASEGVRAVLWQDDFSNAGNWTMGVWPGAPALNWVIGTEPASGPVAIAEIASTTASNGYAMIDSDAFGNEIEVESSYLTNATPIDLTGYSNVVLEFQTFYRKWTYEECFVVVSTVDANWPALDPEFDVETHNATSVENQVYYVFPGMQTQDPVDNPTLVRINISDIAGGASEVYVRFHWTGTYGYAWYVDDVKIIEQPQFDLVMDYGYVSHLDNGNEYGRVPTSQLNNTMYLGGGFYNFGWDTNNDVQLTVEATGPQNFTHTVSVPMLAPEEEQAPFEAVTTPTLTEGLYTFDFELVSTEEQPGGEFFDNNTIDQRAFEVTSAANGLYSLDNIGNHPTGTEVLTSLGSNSFTDNEDGMMCMTMYNVTSDITVYGLEILLATGTTGTQSGGSVNIALFDSADIQIDTTTFTPNLTNALAESSTLYTITAGDVTAGMLSLPFADPVTLTPGNYYASVELYGSGTNHRIRILDDETVPQPAWSSLVYLPNDATSPNRIWSNGNAFAVRLSLNQSIGMAEQNELAGVSMYPNPTNGLLNINLAETGAYDVEVFDMLGARILTDRIVKNTVLDLTGNAQGVYMVRISNEQGSKIERITLK
jgi:hypothetical protein